MEFYKEFKVRGTSFTGQIIRTSKNSYSFRVDSVNNATHTYNIDDLYKLIDELNIIKDNIKDLNSELRNGYAKNEGDNR